MSPRLKNFLLICVKNALNALLTNAGLTAAFHSVFNTYSAAGLWNLGKAALIVVAAREAMVWGPVLLKWSTTDATPDSLEKK